MIEGLLIIAGVCLVVWGIRHMMKKPVPELEVKRPKMPPVRPPASPRQEIPYSQGRLVRPTVGLSIHDKDGRDVFGLLDELVGVVEELADSVSTRKRHSKSSDDDTWGGIDYD